MQKLSLGQSKCFFKSQRPSFLNALLIFVATMLAACNLVSCARPSLPPPPSLAQPAAKWQVAWSRFSLTTTHGQYLAMRPALMAGRLYTANAKGQVSSVQAATGHTVWKNNTHTPISSGVAVGRNHVFVGTAAGNLLALSVANGKLDWFQSLSSSMIAPPMVYRGHVFVKSEGSDVYAYQTQQGHVLWNFVTPSPELVFRLGGAIVPYKRNVIAAFANGQIASLSQDSGFPNWRIQFVRPQGSTVVERMVDIDATPIVSGNTLYVASYQGKVAAINAANGHVKWQMPLSSFSGMALDDRALYVTDVSGRMWAFNRFTGRVLWRQMQLQGRGASAPALFQGEVVVGDAGGFLYAFDRSSGSLQAMTRVTKAPMISKPLVFANLLIVSCQNGRVKAYHLRQA